MHTRLILRHDVALQVRTLFLAVVLQNRTNIASSRPVMTRDLVTITRDTPLADAARRLVDERVHRLLVTDKNGKLYGVLSTFDFAKVVADGANP
jgi:CBS domain-containing protein